mmetsp:Transcript_2459/g.2845  ORF Transcript_2459/g.2845 Transcript_2459/m.2845 type:complete len:148 (-) Transcript_2459:169-612(-)
MMMNSHRLLFCKAKIHHLANIRTEPLRNVYGHADQFRNASSTIPRNKRKIMQKLSGRKSTSASINWRNKVDYSKPPPIIPSPPPPPPREGVRRWVFPATLVTTAVLTLYVYYNNQNDSYEYWNAMQSGEIANFDFDDDDDFEDEDED